MVYIIYAGNLNALSENVISFTFWGNLRQQTMDSGLYYKPNLSISIQLNFNDLSSDS